ncbi:hypothetical protein [Planctomicrobium piriforme]|uniref:Uncharacterized protein n=1 Tax=Planctomicrobium piriforme TaxID=1576369 RepID=A0A1I3E1G0_9PLAN|nr:hypothetical protein [Planctomicrobium piriforme]SFH92817.1 hypothetical protein SAMN05421753_10440 [Planctomicrobium piriforme]
MSTSTPLILNPERLRRAISASLRGSSLAVAWGQFGEILKYWLFDAKIPLSGVSLVFWLTAVLSADQPLPHLSITPEFGVFRSQAPLQLRVQLGWDSSRILRGRLQLEFYAQETKIHTWVSREVVLAASEIDLPVQIPPVLLRMEGDSLNIVASLITEQGTFSYKEIQNALHWPDWKRVLMLGLIHPEGGSGQTSDFLASSTERLSWAEPFDLTRTLPDRDWARHISCRRVPLDPSQVPLLPLELMSFDLLLVTSEGFAALSEAQLNALAEWTEGGGALCVAGKTAKSRRHQAFLERMTLSSAVEPTMQFDDVGMVRSLQGKEWSLTSPGMGRALVTFRPINVDSPAWKAASLELWRIKESQRESILSAGHWSFVAPDDFDHMIANTFFHPLAPDRRHEQELVSLLMPNRVSQVPFHIVALILVACLLAIGPGDYLLLSWLGLRRWTWVLFPSLAIATGLVTMLIAQSYMGAADYRTSISFIDLTEVGKCAKASRFEMTFTATEKELQEEFKQILTVPVENHLPSAAEIEDPYLSSRVPAASASLINEAPATDIGRVPLNYTHVRKMQQWKPQLTRQTSIGSNPEVQIPELNWQEFNPAALSDEVIRQRLLNEIQSVLPDGRILLLHQDEIYSASKLESTAVPQSIEAIAVLARQVGASPQSGLFQIFSQISPSGSGQFEDLALLDRSDPEQWLLIVVASTSPETHFVYRRLIRGTEP